MTPEFAAGFNAGIAAAREIVFKARLGEIDQDFRCVDSHISTLSVPSDLVAVPREPNHAMLVAGSIKASKLFMATIHEDTCATIYRAMIAATEDKT